MSGGKGPFASVLSPLFRISLTSAGLPPYQIAARATGSSKGGLLVFSMRYAVSAPLSDVTTLMSPASAFSRRSMMLRELDVVMRSNSPLTSPFTRALPSGTGLNVIPSR